LSGTGLTNEVLLDLSKQLNRFSNLKQLNLSQNSSLRLMPIGLMMICVNLTSFKCQGCSFVMPRQRDLDVAENNPKFIRSLLMQSPDFVLSKTGLQPTDLNVITELLPQFTALTRIDISGNPNVGDAGVLSILSVLSGAAA
jgi:hypothetical protein